LFLGVPHEAVMADYLATNESFRPTMAGFNKEFAARGGDPAIIEAFMAALPEYLDAGLERIGTSFGSIEAYFSKGLGLDSGTLRALEDAFLE
jgi:protein-tyrosine phosphatase